ncbi:MAG: type II-A CRISPR-associated protein Csn2 [Oscillospiraceae bacterium]|jgi:CRISPR-associated protein Csn2|nr:type II-A CRISPR-associated protein Csn2 [Oscillospiraceae bacterium]
MRFVHNQIESFFETDCNKISVLVCENPLQLTKLTEELLQQTNGNDGNFRLFKSTGLNPKELSVFGNVELVLSPFLLDFNNSTLLKKLYKHLAQKANGDVFYSSTVELKKTIAKYIDSLLFDEPIEFSFEADLDFSHLFKAADIKFIDSNKNLPENLLEYMEIIQTFTGEKLFVFVNIKSFLTQEQLSALYDTWLGREYNVLLIEGRQSEKMQKESVVVIDNDLCEITC